MAETIAKVLYPEDNHYEGKSLRLKQQYFFVSATVQSIVTKHLETYGTLKNFHEKNIIQINDTHPALVIPELMRIMGFPENYVLIGTQGEQKKFIGNAVEVNMARVLCEALVAKLYELNIVPQRFAAQYTQ